MVRTSVGYAGGTTSNPTYTSLGDHTETVRIEYDPGVVSYAELLEVFFASHAADQVPWSTQYRSVILYGSEEQRRLADQAARREAERLGRTVHTAIEPAGPFATAEDYHQKHGLQRFDWVMREFEAMYPSFPDLVGSTAAARVNGYVSGHGTVHELEEEIGEFGLSAAARERLLELVAGLPRSSP